MKTIVRAFVVVLVLTGVAASNHLAASAQTLNATENATLIAQTRAIPSAMPIPTCPPDDPNACGIVRPK